jgi:hypothetical protein
MDFKSLPAFQHLQWDPDPAELRRFGRAMWIGFGLLGLLAWWRRGALGPPVLSLWSTGVVLGVASLVPGLSRIAYLAVYVPTSLIGYVVSRVLLVGVYFGMFVPIGLVLRLTGKDLLGSEWEKPQWQSHPDRQERRRYYRQY